MQNKETKIPRANKPSTEIVSLLALNQTNHRRVSKTLVEFTIGAIGIIGIMLALIGGQHHDKEPGYSAVTSRLHIAYQLTESVSDKVASLEKVSPLASQINWSNILF